MKNIVDVLLMLVVISVILYIYVIVKAKPVLINQSKPFTATGKNYALCLTTMTTTMDHVSDASSIEPELEISEDTAIQQPLKLLSPKLLSPIAEEKEPRT